jgi:tetratricopeptide (TPR) repeat protein
MAYFNYHVLKSKKEVAGGATEYNPAEVKKAMGYIDKGITAFPNRLDMRFGKISLLGDLKNYKGFTEEIIKTIDKAQKNKNAWLWTNNVPQAAPGDFMLTNISEFVRLLIQVGSGEPIDNATDISELVLKNYPNHPESLVNLASCYLLKKQDNKAVSLLLKAEQINYEDISALTKLASIYKTRGDKQKALEYYDKIIRFGDKAEKEEARKEVELLKQK